MMASLLYGVRPHDPAVFVVVPLLLFAVAVLASCIQPGEAGRGSTSLPREVEGSWPARRPQTRAEVPPQYRRIMWAHSIEQTAIMDAVDAETTNPATMPRPASATPLCKNISECRPAARPGPCGYRSRAIFGRPYKPTSRKFDGSQKHRQSSNPPTRSAEKRREASDRSRTSFIDETSKTGKLGSMLWISCRICGSSRVAGRDVRNTTLSRGGVLIGRNVDVGNAIDVETVTLDILNNTHDGRPMACSIFSEPHVSAQRILGGQYLRAVLSSMMPTSGLPFSSPSVNERPRRSVACNT